MTGTRVQRGWASVRRGLELLGPEAQLGLEQMLGVALSQLAVDRGRSRLQGQLRRDGGAGDELRGEAIAAAFRAEIRALRAGDARVSCDRSRELLTIPVAAARAGVPTSTVRDWIANGDLVPVGRYGQRDLTTAEDVAAVARGKNR